jgi:Protein of unknown function (DUF2867)
MQHSTSELAVQTLRDRDAFDVQALAGLHPIHYSEAFAIDVDTYRRPEDWMRLIMEDAFPHKRAAMLRTWKFLGLTLAPLSSEGQVLGWRVQHSGANDVVLAAESRSGLSARIVVTATPQRVVQAMVVRYDRWFARPLWRFIAPNHRRFVKGLLKDVVPRAVRSSRPGLRQREGS